MKTKEGFTLLEMVIVMTIIAILFLLTVPNMNQVITSASKKGCDAQTKVVDTAIVQYMLDQNVQSVSINELVAGGYLNESQIKCQNGSQISIVDNHATSQ